MIQDMSFQAVKERKGLIGYVGFRVDGAFSFSDIGVYRLARPKGNIRVRLRYPDRMSISQEVQREIDEEANSYICANYPEAVK